MAVLSKVGFRETGRAARTLQIGDEWFDSIYLRLDRPYIATSAPTRCRALLNSPVGLRSGANAANPSGGMPE